MGDEQLHVFRLQGHRHGIRGGGQVQKSPHLGGLPNPGFIIAVSVENNPLMLLDGILNQGVKALAEVLRPLQNVCVLAQRLSHGGIEHDVGAGNGIAGTQHPELKLVAGKGKGRGTVPVGGVPEEPGQHIRAQTELLFLHTVVGSILFHCLQHRRQLIP